jgi:hypothetical protein
MRLRPSLHNICTMVMVSTAQMLELEGTKEGIPSLMQFPAAASRLGCLRRWWCLLVN